MLYLLSCKLVHIFATFIDQGIIPYPGADKIFDTLLTKRQKNTSKWDEISKNGP